jgi:hypothetical protein
MVRDAYIEIFQIYPEAVTYIRKVEMLVAATADPLGISLA